MEKKNFNPVIVGHDLYVGLCKDGLLESEKTYQSRHLYIIGIDISYGTIDYHEYNKFTMVWLNEFQIVTCFRDTFGVSILTKRQKDNTSNGNLLLEIINIGDKDNVWSRIDNIRNRLGTKQLPIFNFEQIKDILNIPELFTKYEHIDINLGVNFNKQ